MESWKVAHDVVIGVNSQRADIRDREAVYRLTATYNPDWIILCAAYTDVDACEEHPEIAWSINTEGAAVVAHAAREHGASLMLLSSDYVFDGSGSTPYEVDDPIRPLNVYGRTKAQAESRVRDILPATCVLRTSWLFGEHGRSFPNTILRLTSERDELSIVDDQWGSPTYTPELAHAIIRLAHAGARGSVHFSNSGITTWYEIADEIARTVGWEGKLTRISRADLKRPARRPAYSALSHRSLAAYGIVPRAWQVCLQEYLQTQAAYTVHHG